LFEEKGDRGLHTEKRGNGEREGGKKREVTPERHHTKKTEKSERREQEREREMYLLLLLAELAALPGEGGLRYGGTLQSALGILHDADRVEAHARARRLALQEQRLLGIQLDLVVLLRLRRELAPARHIQNIKYSIML
jgi:hypothetical protein